MSPVVLLGTTVSCPDDEMRDVSPFPYEVDACNSRQSSRDTNSYSNT